MSKPRRRIRPMPEPPVMPPASAPAPLDLAAIRALLEALPPGPYTWDAYPDRAQRLPGMMVAWALRGAEEIVFQAGTIVDETVKTPAILLNTETAAFFAAAPAAVAALLAEVDRLRDLVDYYQAQ